jgi:hypothetical protein
LLLVARQQPGQQWIRCGQRRDRCYEMIPQTRFKNRGRTFCAVGAEAICITRLWLYSEPDCRRRRRKWKSQIWDCKIWSRVPRDSELRKATPARTSSIYKRQTRLLVRECAPEKEDRNTQRVINIWSWPPHRARHQDLLIDWPSAAMWLWLDSEPSSRREVNAVTVLVQWRVNNSRGRSTQIRQRIGTRSTEENKRSAGEELAQCDYSKTDSVIINCNSAWRST